MKTLHIVHVFVRKERVDVRYGETLMHWPRLTILLVLRLPAYGSLTLSTDIRLYDHVSMSSTVVHGPFMWTHLQRRLYQRSSSRRVNPRKNPESANDNILGDSR